MACQALAIQGLPLAVIPVVGLGACFARLFALVKVTPLLQAIKQLPRVVVAPVPAKWACTPMVKPRMLVGLLKPLNVTNITLGLPPAAAINAANVALHTYAPGVTHKALLCGLTVLGSAWGGNGAPATVPTTVVFFTLAIIVNPLVKPSPIGLVLSNITWGGGGCNNLNAPTTYVLGRRVHTNVTGGGGY